MKKVLFKVAALFQKNGKMGDFYKILEEKFDPMMDDSSDDGLPDLEELPALTQNSNENFEVFKN